MNINILSHKLQWKISQNSEKGIFPMFGWIVFQRKEVVAIPTEAEFEYKLSETDAYLQLMIDQVKVHKLWHFLWD